MEPARLTVGVTGRSGAASTLTSILARGWQKLSLGASWAIAEAWLTGQFPEARPQKEPDG